MFFVDTNIILHAVNTDSPDHEPARRALETYSNSNDNWAVSWGVIYEYLRVSTHPRVFPKPLTIEQSWSFIHNILESQSLMLISETEAHQKVLESCRKDIHRLAGNLIHDFHIAVLMREHGMKEIVTLDTDFRAFPWIKIKPLE